EAMMEAAATLNLPTKVAATLVASTIEGAGAMLSGADDPPEVLRQQVTSPGGTTAAALQVLEERGFRISLVEAIRAAARRSGELGA
ncbi:MAG TPA: pyrroline-5-carboxylate reductase dimerization domain-containing protein, partial [Actinomycetota bacterium]|nr:pyrroline-5-carboxylate reductase dimerization domain-containing protein [Actinomycetota bacterium]